MAMSSTERLTKHPVVEIFGPTIQGEGIDQGIPCYFIRFGGCDYRCDWCDTPYAVLPHSVKAANRLDYKEIISNLGALSDGPEWVILSGGNPVLHELSDLVHSLKSSGYKIGVETQGTRFRLWLKEVDRVAVSPKPPSSGHVTNLDELDQFMVAVRNAFLKVVVFDQTDYSFAKTIHLRYPDVPMFLSAGNDAGATVGNPSRIDNRTDDRIRLDLIHSGRRLANWAMMDLVMSDVRIQIQNHVLYWSNEQGV